MHQGVVLHLAYLTPIKGFGRARHSQPTKRDPESDIQFRVSVMHRLLDLCKGSFKVCNRISYRGVMAFLFKAQVAKGQVQDYLKPLFVLEKKKLLNLQGLEYNQSFPPVLKRTELYPQSILCVLFLHSISLYSIFMFLQPL